MLIRLNITFTSNNIIAHLCNKQGNIFATTSSGQLEFKGSTKHGLVAAETIAVTIAEKINNLKLNIPLLIINIRGISKFKDGFLKKLFNYHVNIQSIYLQHYVKIAHNGCKLPKKRRK